MNKNFERVKSNDNCMIAGFNAERRINGAFANLGLINQVVLAASRLNAGTHTGSAVCGWSEHH